MRTPRTTLKSGFSIATAFLAVGLGVLALTCGRTPLFRCDLVGCAQGICVDAGHSQGDSGSDMFKCTLPDGGAVCVGLGQTCDNSDLCCAGSECNSSGVCAAVTADAGSCHLNGTSCVTGTDCCSANCDNNLCIAPTM